LKKEKKMKAEILLYIDEKEQRDIYFKCLTIEYATDPFTQRKIKVFKYDPNIIKIYINMSDISKLRAIINSYIRLIQVIYTILKLEL